MAQASTFGTWIRNNGPGGVANLKSIAATSSTGEGTRFLFDRPLTNWALQVVSTSTTTHVLLQAGIATSSGALLTTIATWASTAGQANGDTVFIADKPANVVAAFSNAGTSGGASAWITGT
jgi:hypothetical protein